MITQHHTKYLELDGEDEIVLIPQSEHVKHRLERGFKIPSWILQKAHDRSPKCKETNKRYNQSENRKRYLHTRNKSVKEITFTETVGWNVQLFEAIKVSPNGFIFYVSRFRPCHGIKLLRLDI